MEGDQVNKYFCKICLKPFERKRFLRRHLIIRHQITIFRSDGSQIFYKRPTKKVHKFSGERLEGAENGNPVFKCDSCDATFKTKNSLWDHRPRHKEENYIICAVSGCGHRMYKRDRSHHMRQIHTFQTQLCEICSRTFRNYECLRRHRYKVHDAMKCKGCKKSFLKKEKDNHQCSQIYKLKPELERNHPCGSCERSYTSAFLLKRHMKEKHNFIENPAILECPNCHEEFESRELLNRHKKICRCVLCPVCSVPFKTNEKLDQHMERHAEEKSARKFACTQCSCRFNYPRILAAHIQKRHTNEEVGFGMNFECPLCDFMCRRAKLLTVHIESRHKIFMDDLDTVCAICHQSCGDDLPKHMQKEHKKTFVCNFEGCKKKFRTQESLQCHERTHEPGYEPDLSCSVCLKVFQTQKSLVEHFKQHAKVSEPRNEAKKSRKKKRDEESEESD